MAKSSLSQPFEIDKIRLKVTVHREPYGHVAAVLGVIRKLGLDTIIEARRDRTRDLVPAMVV